MRVLRISWAFSPSMTTSPKAPLLSPLSFPWSVPHARICRSIYQSSRLYVTFSHEAKPISNKTTNTFIRVCASLLSDKINQIKNDRSNGASQISRNALDALKFFVQTNKSTTRGNFDEDLKKVGLRLFEARENMAPVQNLVAQAVYNIINFKENDFESTQRFAVSTIDALSAQSKSAVKESATKAAELIADSDCVATCSDSSTVCETLKTAKEQGKQFKVVVAQSQTGSISYGEVMARFLESIDVSAKIFRSKRIVCFGAG